MTNIWLKMSIETFDSRFPSGHQGRFGVMPNHRLSPALSSENEDEVLVTVRPKLFFRLRNLRISRSTSINLSCVHARIAASRLTDGTLRIDVNVAFICRVKFDKTSSGKDC
jgi:hypothetical protein